MAEPDLHPDADILNAFVERALPEAERARVVAHMAGCGRCREVVFLAQMAAEQQIAPQIAAAKPLKTESRPGWFSAAFGRWRVALIPATALAVVGGIVLWVQLHPGTQGTQMAKLVPPAEPASSQAAPAQLAARQAQPTASEREEAPTADKAFSASSSKPIERAPALQHKKTPAEGVVAMDELAPTDAPKAPAVSTSAGQSRETRGIHLDGRSAAMARYAVPPPQALGAPSAATFSASPPSPEGQQPPMNAGQLAALTVDSAAAPNVPAPAPAPPNIVAVHGTAMGASAGPAKIAAPPSSKVELAPQPMNGLAVMQLARRVRLPSGLNTVSSAALLNRLVAVDSAGGVFQSQDGGKRWEAVPAHWTGKAVHVQAPTHGLYTLTSATETQSSELTPVSTPDMVSGAPEESPAAPAPPPAAATSAAPSAGNAKPAPPVLPVQFKLVTDRHEVWVSADGKAWRRQ